ncbi:MAG: sulfotransferase [Gemmatimonadota bacterium]|jgi:hypothetical protein|nr:sulfotransferase [Gemmatimonadota bacterium]MDP6528384.1 sulfotransferase [Gemmatimonadota bacterium]MDP6802840.1 sulfotransferase [Gemmatimonadota bacterium]MDP7031053.1 sulfotransferase [Gemmatimonadota bacterium]
MIFVVGSSRSGTTLMGRILGRHSAVHFFHELHFFEQLWAPADRGRILSMEDARELGARLFAIERHGYLRRQDPSAFEVDAQEMLAREDPSALTKESVFRAFLHREAANSEASIPCDQTPRNAYYAKEILDLFPDARIIQMVRDPRDVLLSQKRKWRRRKLGATRIPRREALRSWINYHPLLVGRFWEASLAAGRRVAMDPRHRWVKYEDLAHDPDGTVDGICAFLGIRREVGMLDVPHRGSSAANDAADRGVREDRVRAWSRGGLNDSEIALCDRATRTGRAAHGYADSTRSGSWPGFACYAATLPVRLGAAFLMNLGRMRDLRSTLARRMGRA